MKIAIVGTYPPQKDGIGIYTSRYVEALRDQGHEVEVFSFKGNENIDNGVVGCLSRNNPFSYFSTALKIHRFNPDKVLIQYEYVHYNMLWFPKLLCWLKLLGHKINLMMHAVAPYERGWKAFVFKMVHLSLFLFVDRVFLHTQSAKASLLRKTWKKPKIEVVPIAIKPVSGGKEASGKAGKNLLSFGFISYDKGTDVLCKAMKGLPDVKLTISGSVSPYAMQKQHDYLEGIKGLCSGKKNINLINRYVSEKEKDEMFSKADFFVLPYRFIEQSAVLTEVWGYGKIPICSDVAGFREEIDGKYGVLFKQGDVESLRAAIQDIIKDSKKQKEILSNIEGLIKERSFSASALKLIELLS